MEDETPSRRKSDKRLADLDARVSEVQRDVRSIRDMLISEPEASPLGRSLLKASQVNRQLIDQHRAEFFEFKREEFEPIERWHHETAGAWKTLTGLALVLGSVATFFAIASWFGFGAS